MLEKVNGTGDFPGYRMNVTFDETINIEWIPLRLLMQRESSKKAIVFVDPVVLTKQDYLLEYESTFDHFTLVPTNLSEYNKDTESLQSILRVLEDRGTGRRDTLIYAVGGGALIDTVALATALYRRGVHLVKVPTTLLAFVDASIGIKTAVNFLGQRNRIGIYNPRFNVALDPTLLKSLNPDLVRQGLGEIFKIAIIKSRELYELIVANSERVVDTQFYLEPSGRRILDRAIHLMLEELHDNPTETNLRRVVDYGHTFSPLVEMASISRTDSGSLSHGHAVAFDCLLSALISHERGILSGQVYDSIIDLYRALGFSCDLSLLFDSELAWSSLLEMTKHRGGRQSIPVPKDIGESVFIDDLSLPELSAALDKLKAQLTLCST